MPGRGGFTIKDNTDEDSSFSFNTGNITSVSIAGTLTQFGALRTATEGLIRGTIKSERLNVFDTLLSNTPPSDTDAQRETKWLVTYEDNLPFFDDPINAIPNAGYHKIFTLEIGTADLSLLVSGESELDLADTEAAAWITAFEALARSPYGGTVNVLGIAHVGRNL